MSRVFANIQGSRDSIPSRFLQKSPEKVNDTSLPNPLCYKVLSSSAIQEKDRTPLILEKGVLGSYTHFCRQFYTHNDTDTDTDTHTHTHTHTHIFIYICIYIYIYENVCY